VALIELDLDATPAPAPSRPPPRYFRYVAVLACAVLVLALGAAAPAVAVLWQRAGVVPLAGASTSYQLVGGLLYTLDGNAGRRTTTAWSLYPVRKLWTVSTALQLDSSGSVIQDGASLSAAGGYTLLQASDGTTVIDPRSGQIRWASRAPFVAYDGDVGIVQRTEFPPGTEYDQSSGDPGPLYWSEDGVPHTQPPDHTALRGLDLGTGRVRWTVSERGSVYVVPALGDATGFVVIAADRLSALAADTGAVLRAQALPHFASSDISYPDLMGEVLILRHDVSDTGAGTATAFGMDTLEQRWQVTEPPQDGGAGGCLGLPCERDGDRVAVLDPATGVPLWYAPRTVTVFARGHEVLELLGTSRTPVRVLDARTGRVKVDLTGWQTVADAADDAPIVVYRAEAPTGRAGFGVLAPGASRVQLLGLSSQRVEQCAADQKYVACRTASGVEVWSYRAS
jgi:putative pyrroloquinoline-quinone binding quinoprotein